MREKKIKLNVGFDTCYKINLFVIYVYIRAVQVRDIYANRGRYCIGIYGNIYMVVIGNFSEIMRTNFAAVPKVLIFFSFYPCHWIKNVFDKIYRITGG